MDRCRVSIEKTHMMSDDEKHQRATTAALLYVSHMMVFLNVPIYTTICKCKYILHELNKNHDGD